MPAKPSGKTKTIIVKNKQKNGDTYVLERKIKYNAEKKQNDIIESRLMAKIPKGSEIQVPTRPKRLKSVKHQEVLSDCDADGQLSANQIVATRQRVGMMGIIDHVGRESGIDDALYAITDTGTAQKIISLARYLLATNGQSLPGILTWQYNHPIPYAEGLSEDIYHGLFREIGFDETLQQNFFLSRCLGLEDGVCIAYDSTAIGTYSEQQTEARYGFDKSGSGLKAVKYLTLYSIDTRQPIAFTKQPGNLPDVITVGNALSQLMVLGVKKAEVVTDNGYYSEKNLSEMFQSNHGFITLAKTNLKWIRPEIEKSGEELNKISSACPFDHTTRGVTVILMHDFVKVRKYGSKKTGASRGDEEIFRRKIYLHIYFNAARKVEEDNNFEQDLMSIKAMLEGGTKAAELNEAAQKKAGKFLAIKTWGKTIHVSFNENACAQAKKWHGYFTLVSNSEKETFKALEKYRKREYVENYFRSAKQSVDSTRTRVWNADTLRGRMFVQFVALSYYEFLSEKIRKIKMELDKPCDGFDARPKSRIKLEKKLKSWLDNSPIYMQLQWFDAIEGVNISSKLKNARWSTEITSRDELYLEKLGMSSKFI